MVKYVALLRRINISGKNKIPMKDLKFEFERLGYKDVVTYLNSGNVVFSSDTDDKNKMYGDIYKMIESKFGFKIPLYIISAEELKDLLDHHPNWWGNVNKDIYDNIIFIIPPTTYKEVYDTLGEPKKDYEKIEEYKNNIFWSYILKDYRKTNWWSKTASTSISNSITVRTANTMKKVLELCD